MANKHLTILVIITIIQLSCQAKDDSTIDLDPLKEAASAILNEQNAENIGAIVNNVIQSGGAQKIGNILLDAIKEDKSGKILEGLGSILKGKVKGFDPSLVGNMLDVVSQTNSKAKNGGGFDFSNLLPLLSSFMGEGGNMEGIMDFLPNIMEMYNSFTGPEAKQREQRHSDHAWQIPPLAEKAHLLFDHFLNSEMGKSLINTVGAEKFMKIFSDETGKFNYDKFVEMLENHSFRKHWISMVTNRIAHLMSYIADANVYKKYLASTQYFVNSYIKSQGYPKAAMFDASRPTETITALINQFAKRELKMKFDSRQYVKPIVDYVQEVFRLAQQRGILLESGVNSTELSNKLADTINMEIIEPIMRVNRAYRFAKKVPKCDRYVMCLLNQQENDGSSSLPGLKSLLSKGASLVASWFLSVHTNTSFWSLYHVILEENNCQARYLDECNDFHIEEIKVTTEYVHNEL